MDEIGWKKYIYLYIHIIRIYFGDINVHLVYYYDFSYFSLLRIIYPAGLFSLNQDQTLLVGNQFLRIKFILGQASILTQK